MAPQLTLENYPQTAEGHRRLLARAVHLEHQGKQGWQKFYQGVRDAQQSWFDFQELVGFGQPHPAGAPQPSAEDALKRLQQALEQLGRMSQCMVCFGRVDAAELTPTHPRHMKILACGHFLCGGCGHALWSAAHRPDSPGCPVGCPCCRQDTGKQLADCQEADEAAVSRKRARQEVSDLLPAANLGSPEADGCHASRFKGSCYLCEIPWAAGALVAKHARLPKKITCPGCKEAPMPCTFCAGDASESDVLKNGKGASKKFFCLRCIKQKAPDDLKGICGVTVFLGKHA